MVARDFVFLEEVFDNVLSAVRIVESPVALEKCIDLLFVEMSLRDLFLRQGLDSLENLLVGHLEDDELRWSQSRLKHFLCVFFRLFALSHWNSHEDFSSVFVPAWESIENVAAVEAIILS